MEIESLRPLRPLLRRWLRPSLPLSLRSRSGNGRHCHRSAVCGPGDLRHSYATSGSENRGGRGGPHHPLDFLRSLALDACAIATALAPQRLSITSATGIALVLATPTPQTLSGSALASQRFAVNRSWGVGVSWKAAARLRLPEATAEVIASIGEHRVLSTAQVRANPLPGSQRAPR